MSTLAPLILARTAAELRADIAQKLHDNTGWVATDPQTGEPDQASAALIAIAARFGEIAIERLNQAPAKNFLAFLDLLGATRLPPEPARVPLTFTVTAGSATDAVVPAGTQVAAARAEGDEAPVIFETERELTAVAANLQTLFAVDAHRDLIAERSALIATPVAEGERVFSGNRPNEHVLYLSCTGLLSRAQLATLTLTFHMSADIPAAPDVRALKWEIWDGVNGTPLQGTVDSTQALRNDGQVTFTNVQQVPEQTVNGVRGRWLRCKLLTPVSPSADAAQGMVRTGQLPLIGDIRASAVINRSALAAELAFANGAEVDVSRAFLPFGSKPAIGDVFYLGQREALGQPGSSVTLTLALVNPIPDGANPPVPSSDLKLRWETWDGAGWALLGETTRTGAAAGTSLVDNSKAFTKNGTVTFTLPQTLAPTTVNGVEGNWVRVHIVAGNYGVEAFHQPDTTQPGGFRLVPATFAPPLVRSIALAYSVTIAPATPDAVTAFNNEQFEDLGSALLAGRAAPFVGFPSQPPALYCGFTLPPARRTFPNRTVSLYHGVRQPPYGERTTPLSPGLSVQTASIGNTAQHTFVLTNTSAESVTFDLVTFGGAWASSAAPAQVTLQPGLATEIKVSVVVPGATNASDRGYLQLRLSSEPGVHSVAFETRVGAVASRRRELRYEYWNGRGWARLIATDGTDRLEHPGVVEFLAPGDFPAAEMFGRRAYWVRALFESGDDPPVQLSSLLLNTTFASHAVTVRNEVLGASDASARQAFVTTRTPVLAGAQLEVRESEAWVKWTEVADFHGSTAEDRHYILDHISGRVLFGDGVQGRIPPRGSGNIRMVAYRTGGGSSGNRVAGTITQLKTTVPYIEKVGNLEPSRGGVAAESDAALVARAPRALRHGGRAVALQDYEDLALAASPEVVRARSVPLRRLQDDPLGNTRVSGAISVIVVPQSEEARPLPSSALMTLVANHLQAHATPTASLAVVGPLYVRVDVSIEVALVSLDGASAVEQAVLNVLRQFLHPLSGGRDGTGWDFGRQPHLSDLHAVVAEVPGVDHIRALDIEQIEEPPGALATGRFLVYSGQHHITLTFVGAE